MASLLVSPEDREEFESVANEWIADGSGPIQIDDWKLCLFIAIAKAKGWSIAEAFDEMIGAAAMDFLGSGKWKSPTSSRSVWFD